MLTPPFTLPSIIGIIVQSQVIVQLRSQSKDGTSRLPSSARDYTDEQSNRTWVVSRLT